MKKKYLFLGLMLVGTLGFSQTAYLDFEGTDPLNNLPTGITNVEPTGTITIYRAPNLYYYDGTTTLALETNTEEQTGLSQSPNIIITDSELGSKVIQLDYTGHLMIDENVIGEGDFSISMKYSAFGHRMGSAASILTIVGQDSSDGNTWKEDRLLQKSGGWVYGLDIHIGDGSGGDGTPGGSIKFANTNALPLYDYVTLTYTSSDQKYKLYKDGVLLSTSQTAQESGEWDNRKIFLGYMGSSLNQTTGLFDENSVSNNGRTQDIQKRYDNIAIFNTALSDAEVLTLSNNGGVLSTKSITTEKYFEAYPNPVKNQLNFTSEKVSSVEIYNVLGSKIQVSKVVNGQVNTSQLSIGGIYFVKCINDIENVVKTIRIIKK
ncbi:T9SS type A sorting domain-containing protein [Polaribacter vadi]|uniref:T9SS type A sorting domain-containing protein n=1 Tax=Polaribacter TaxID=52959 RepID=UPI001C08E1D9|nr:MULTISPECIES: T9SS type A sorting domain-containing protein [Polaribacter]MBU3011326.1 T9SS type A sorting domain-containing protein [Polaribacter vadi]MDO6741138.1 T9SS type A sorting domain-containing protein [Polaribacter sp. 1_MG-2023]